MAQAVWQKWISNAIAKTINMPSDVTVEDIKAAYLLSHEMGLKGVTVYRDGSRHEQVLHITGNDKEKKFIVKPSTHVVDHIHSNIKQDYVMTQVDKVFKDAEQSDPADNQVSVSQAKLKTNMIANPSEYMEYEKCPSCTARLIITEGCNMCIECGFSSCMSG
jgi:ribonucleoside-diphosphate reductase alpha chain